MAKGQYRDGEWAYLDEPKTGSIEKFFTRDSYMALGIQPPFDQLPTKEEWERKNV